MRHTKRLTIPFLVPVPTHLRNRKFAAKGLSQAEAYVHGKARAQMRRSRKFWGIGLIYIAWAVEAWIIFVCASAGHSLPRAFAQNMRRFVINLGSNPACATSIRTILPSPSPQPTPTEHQMVV